MFGRIARKLGYTPAPFLSYRYWNERYQSGGNSGAGSYDKLAVYKAEFLNEFVKKHVIETVLEFGCGDGNQLTLAEYPFYCGLDVAPKAVDLCRKLFKDDKNKLFYPIKPVTEPLLPFLSADLVLSLDVIYHLIEDDVYLNYLRGLFSTAHRYVIIYSSNKNEATDVEHVTHRKFSDDIARLFPGYILMEHIPNPYPDLTFADFYIYEKIH